jgi:hypothetical protein
MSWHAGFLRHLFCKKSQVHFPRDRAGRPRGLEKGGQIHFSRARAGRPGLISIERCVSAAIWRRKRSLPHGFCWRVRSPSASASGWREARVDQLPVGLARKNAVRFTYLVAANKGDGGN